MSKAHCAFDGCRTHFYPRTPFCPLHWARLARRSQEKVSAAYHAIDYSMPTKAELDEYRTTLDAARAELRARASAPLAPVEVQE